MEQRTELDSHADTSVVGKELALLIHDYDTPVCVHGYTEEVAHSSNCRIISAVIAYDHPETGDVYMLVIHQAILIPEMENNLLCPMQLHDHGLAVNDKPKYMALNPTEGHHAITICGAVVGDEEALQIPLELHGVTSYFPTRKPTKEEYDNTADELQIELMAECPEWDPTSKQFQDQENGMLDSGGRLKDTIESWSPWRVISALQSIRQQDTPDFYLEDALCSSIKIDPFHISSIKSSTRKPSVDPQKLARNWGIGLEAA